MASGSSDPSESSWWGSGSGQWLSAGSGQWLGSVLASAKDKSAAALSQMSKDLKEFGSTIQHDTTHAVAESAAVIGQNLQFTQSELYCIKENMARAGVRTEDADDRSTGGVQSAMAGLKPEEESEGQESEEGGEKTTTDKVREGFRSFLSSVSQNLAAPEEIPGEEFVVNSKDSHVFDQTKARLHAIQVDPATYCNEPDGSLDTYHDWLESFSVEEKKGDISELLVANSQVRSIYTKLVPAAVSHAEFWGRYFYKVHRLDQDEARRNALKERAEMTSSQTLDDDLGWGDEEDTWDTVPEADRLPDSKPADDSRLKLTEAPPPSVGDSEESTEKAPNRTHFEQSVEHSEVDNKTVEPDPSVQVDRVVGTDAGEEVSAEVDGATEEVKEMALETEAPASTVKVERSPTASSHGSGGNKDSSLGDEWEQDFDDIEITEEDIKNAQLASTTLGQDDDDDWENWE